MPAANLSSIRSFDKSIGDSAGQGSQQSRRRSILRNAFIASSYEARAAGQGGSILKYVTDLDKARNKVDAAQYEKRIYSEQLRGVEPLAKEGAYSSM